MALALGPSLELDGATASLALSQGVASKEMLGSLEESLLYPLQEHQKRLAARKRWRHIKWLVLSGLLIRHSSSAHSESELNWSSQRELQANCPPGDIPSLACQLSAIGSVPKMPAGTDHAGKTVAWRDVCGSSFLVRGHNYVLDRVKISTGEALMRTVAVDWFTDSERMDNMAGRQGCLPQTELGKSLPFIFVVNLQIAGPPWYSLVTCLASDRPIREHPDSLLYRFCSTADDEFRRKRFKLLPRIPEGPWLVRRAVASKPYILGNTLSLRYFKGPNYFEVDVDTGTEAGAARVMAMLVRYLPALIFDVAFFIEAQEMKELPEYVLGCLTYLHLDVKEARPVPQLVATSAAI